MAQMIAIATVAGAAVSAYGAISQAEAQKQASHYNAALNTRNASMAYDQASAEARRPRPCRR